MTLPSFEYLTRRVTTGRSDPNRPSYNAVPISAGGSRLQVSGISYRELWIRLKKSPELVATLSIIVTDIMGDRPDWRDASGGELGKTTTRKAEKFWRQNRGKETVKSWLMDGLLTGDGFIWMGKASREERITAAKESLQVFLEKNHSPMLVKEQMRSIEMKAAQMADTDEELRSTRRFDHLASSTTRIVHDGYDILAYEQVAPGGMKHVFSTEDIIHYRYMSVNGEVQGFSPAESLLSEIFLLWLVKGNMVSFMQNGGSPDKVFILPDEMAQSQNFRLLIETLRKYKTIENRHGNLVVAGKMEVQDLQGSPRDLEYKDLALYITSNIAFAYGIPVTRIPYLIGSASSKGDSGGLSESGYWNRISDMQDTIEDLLNGQLFNPLGWALHFPRKYKQDEIREAQIEQYRVDTVQKYDSVLSTAGVKLKIDKKLEMLKLHPEDIEEQTDEEKMAANGLPNDRQQYLNNDTTMNEQDKNARSETKRQVASKKDANRSARSK